MILEELAKRSVNISTIEDPVEKNVPKLNQMQVNNTAGLTFEVGLRALLRQDPDIIMVGETRDAETASISVRAAITGHLVLSTLHTNDAASSVVRLADMGVEPYMIASSLVGIVAQRLVRKVCPFCGEWGPMTEQEEAIAGVHFPQIKHAKGCRQCNNTGYKGRISIHEILMIDKKVREMITKGASVEEIKDYAVQEQGMSTLKKSALELVENGTTTVDELVLPSVRSASVPSAFPSALPVVEASVSCPQTVVRPVLVLHPSSLVLVQSEPSLHLPYHRHPQVAYLLRAIPLSRPLLRPQFLHPSHVIRWWHPLLHPRHIWIPDSYFRPYRFLLQNCNTFFTVYTFSTSYVNILSRIS